MNLWPITIAVAFILLYSYGRPAATWLYERSKRLRLPSLPSLPLGAQIPVWQALLIVVAVWASMGGLQYQGCTLPQFKLPWSIIVSKPDLVVVLYESEHGEPPAYAAGAVNELRKAKLDARLSDDDPATGLDAVPAELAPAIEPGRKIIGGTDGKGHALVVLSGGKVLKAIELPKSKEAILEACQ
jgi:hypothetical protein